MNRRCYVHRVLRGNGERDAVEEIRWRSGNLVIVPEGDGVKGEGMEILRIVVRVLALESVRCDRV